LNLVLAVKAIKTISKSEVMIEMGPETHTGCSSEEVSVVSYLDQNVKSYLDQNVKSYLDQNVKCLKNFRKIFQFKISGNFLQRLSC